MWVPGRGNDPLGVEGGAVLFEKGVAVVDVVMNVPSARRLDERVQVGITRGIMLDKGVWSMTKQSVELRNCLQKFTSVPRSHCTSKE